MQTVLIVGAGATIEECFRSGNFRNDSTYLFPTIANMARKFFTTQPLPISVISGDRVFLPSHSNLPALYIVLEQYLAKHNFGFDDGFLNLPPGQTFGPYEMRNSSREVFLKLEEQSPETHNVERLFQFAWNMFGKDTQFWRKFVHDSIYFELSVFFTQQFGMGSCVEMKAGCKVARLLSPGDRVINLNYDICFDAALVQTGTNFTYSPKQDPNGVTVFKPHGSMNLFVNIADSTLRFFTPPDQMPTTGAIERDGGVYSAHGGIMPPIMEKNYRSHPLARFIIDSGQPFTADRVIFWGVGLTDSDTDLLQIYRDLTGSAQQSFFINPSESAFQRAKSLLGCDLKRISRLEKMF